MANQFVREPIPGGDVGTWSAFELAQNRSASRGACTAKLYDNAGALTISKGRIGIDDGTNEGVAEIDTITAISIAAVSNSNWGKIELTVSGTSVTIAVADIAGATDPSALPAGFTGAYDALKGGFYISANKRVIGLAWKNAGGTLEGIVNCMQNLDGYIGYSQSDDADDFPYYFEKIKEEKSDGTPNNAINSNNFSNLQEVIYRDSTGTETTVRIKKKIIEIGDWNMNGAGAGAYTLNVAHGLGDPGYKRVRRVSAIIRADTDNFYLDFVGGLHDNTETNTDSQITVGLTNVALQTMVGGRYDSTTFDSTSYNRGWIFIDYEE